MSEDWEVSSSDASMVSTVEEDALAAFNRDLEEGFARIGAAAVHLQSISGTIEAARNKLDVSLEGQRRLEELSRASVEEVRTLVSEIRENSEKARAARDEAIEIRNDVHQVLGDLKALSSDLRMRIAALAVLAQPLPEVSDSQTSEEMNLIQASDLFAGAV